MLFDESRKFDASANVGVGSSTEPAIGDPIEQRMSRRDALARLGVAALANVLAPAAREAAEPTACSSALRRDLDPDMPLRPAVIAITKKGGGAVGS